MPTSYVESGNEGSQSFSDFEIKAQFAELPGRFETCVTDDGPSETRFLYRRSGNLIGCLCRRMWMQETAFVTAWHENFQLRFSISESVVSSYPQASRRHTHERAQAAVSDPCEATVVREVLELPVAGQTPNAIAD